MKSVIVLGSTGSVGMNTLRIVENFSDILVIKGLTAHVNMKGLANQILKFMPEVVVVKDEFSAFKLDKLILNSLIKPKIFFGISGYNYIAGYREVDIILNAIIGGAGLSPTLASVEAGKTIALANKESLVIAGEYITKEVSRREVRLLPVDSEHSAIHQCLLGSNENSIKEIILTASGGPFLERSIETFEGIKKKQALKHPNWAMGKKISIDSATLMNKAFEIIEAKWLFNISLSQIEILIHSDSIIHSMVSFLDNTVLAQMSMTDMKTVIASALFFPNRFEVGVHKLNLSLLGFLLFREADTYKFPCLLLGFKAFELGGILPVVMNTSNEVAVSSFLNGEILFDEIYYVIKNCIDFSKMSNINSIFDIIEADFWAKSQAKKIIRKLKK